MAVIREQRQFKIGPVGVARASEAGAIAARGKAVAAEQIAQSANSLAGDFFQLGAQFAEKRGRELGMAASTEAVMTIDPKTGKPEAYKPAETLGIIANEAYQRVVMSRFQESIENEMQAKARELAVKFEDSPNSVGLYEKAMSEYIASMTNVAQGPFKGYIQDVGTSYLQATRSNLAVNQIRRERAAAASARESAILAGASNIQSLIGELGPESLNGPTQVRGIIESLGVAVDDGVSSNVFEVGQGGRLGSTVAVATIRGLIDYASKQAKDPEQVKLLQYAIGSQNLAAIPDEFGYVRDALAQLGPRYDLLDDIEKYSDGLLSDRSQYLDITVKRQAEIDKANIAAQVFNLGQNTPAIAAVNRTASIQNDPYASAERIRSDWAIASRGIQSSIASGQTDFANAQVESRDTIFNASVEGIYLRALSGLGAKETKQLESAIFDRNPNIAPESSRDELVALFKLEDLKPTILSDFLPLIGSKRDAAGKLIDEERSANAAQALQAEAPLIDNISIQRGDGIAQSIGVARASINGIPDLPDDLRRSRLADVDLNGATAYVSNFFSTRPTMDQVNEAKAYLQGGEAALLTDQQRNMLDAARGLGVSSGRESELRTHFNTLQSVEAERAANLKKSTETALMVGQILIGQGDPTNGTQREAIETYYQGAYGQLLEGRPLASVWSDPDALVDPKFQPMFAEMRKSNVLPESLHDSFTALARGGLTGMNPTVVLSHYANFKDYQYAGVTMRNPAMLALSESQITNLDYLVDALPSMGSDPAAIANILTARSKLEIDPSFGKSVETAFGGKIEDIVFELDGIEAAPASAINEVTASALEMVRSGFALGQSPDAMKDRLQRQFDMRYPDGDGIVFDGFGRTRTSAPISFAAPGNEVEFKAYVREAVAPSFPDRFVTLGRRDAVSANEVITYLEPIGIPGAANNYSYIVKRIAENRVAETVITTVQARDEDGTLVTYNMPLVVSNQDPRFLNRVKATQQRRQSDAMMPLPSIPVSP